MIKLLENKPVALSSSPNRTYCGTVRPIELIILHATVGEFGGAVNWLCTGKRPDPTSAHYVIAKDGRIAQLVPEHDIAWHAGTSSWKGKIGINFRSIGIELENLNDGKDPYTEPLLESALFIVNRACKQYGISPDSVIGHNDIAPDRKTDPLAFPWDRFRESLAANLNDDSHRGV